MQAPTDMTPRGAPVFTTRIAQTAEERTAAQRLRYEVFVTELGGDGPMVDHAARLERDGFDDHADHILLCDETRASDDQVVGVYRVMTADMAQAAGRFYSAKEYDLGPLVKSRKRLLELGRSCLLADYRGGPGMQHLWAALAEYVQARDIDLLFGVASFHGTDVAALAAPLSLLHHRHLARPDLRVRAVGPTALSMNLIPAERLDRVAAVRQMPALIKAYLRLGGTVGDGAFVDHAFNTVDICLLLESDLVNNMQRAFLARGAGRG